MKELGDLVGFSCTKHCNYINNNNTANAVSSLILFIGKIRKWQIRIHYCEASKSNPSCSIYFFSKIIIIIMGYLYNIILCVLFIQYKFHAIITVIVNTALLWVQKEVTLWNWFSMLPFTKAHTLIPSRWIFKSGPLKGNCPLPYFIKSRRSGLPFENPPAASSIQFAEICSLM